MLRQRLILLQRKVRRRVQVENSDRLFLVQLYRWFPSVREDMLIIRPETLVRWHVLDFVAIGAESLGNRKVGRPSAGNAA